MMPPSPPPPPPGNPQLFPDDRNQQAQIFKTEALKTRNLLLAISGLYFVGNALPVIIAGGGAGSIALSLVVTLIFLGLGFLATNQPYTSVIIAGVIIVIMLLLLVVAMSGMDGVPAWAKILPWVIFLAAVGLEIGAFMSAKKAEEARKRM